MKEDTMSVRNWVVTGLVVLSSAFANEAVAQDKAIGLKLRGGNFNGCADIPGGCPSDLYRPARYG